MQSVTIQVHPLSAHVLAAQYGGKVVGPFKKQDCIFDIITAAPGVVNPGEGTKYRSPVTFIVSEPYATRLAQQPTVTAMRLFRFHKALLCFYVSACMNCGGITVKDAIRQWLDLHGVTEDDFSSETAYKIVQRFFWKEKVKSPVFFERLKSRTIVKKTKKMADAEVVKIAVSAFLANYKMLYRRVPAKMEQQVHLYIYASLSDACVSAVARKLGIAQSTLCYTLQSVRKKTAKNPALKRILQEALDNALPQPA